MTPQSSRYVLLKKLCDFTKQDEITIKKKYLEIASEFAQGNYQVGESNRHLITALLRYFTGNENELDLDLSKGIFLFGDYGVGKTIIMQTIRKVLSELFPFNPNGYAFTSIEQISRDFKEDSTLKKCLYTMNDIPMHLCVHEFGERLGEKVYGTHVDDVIESLFMLRYEMFQQHGKLTHVTSNFHPKDLGYPPILSDRMSQMFNFIHLEGESFR